MRIGSSLAVTKNFLEKTHFRNWQMTHYKKINSVVTKSSPIKRKVLPSSTLVTRFTNKEMILVHIGKIP